MPAIPQATSTPPRKSPRTYACVTPCGTELEVDMYLKMRVVGSVKTQIMIPAAMTRPPLPLQARLPSFKSSRLAPPTIVPARSGAIPEATSWLVTLA